LPVLDRPIASLAWTNPRLTVERPVIDTQPIGAAMVLFSKGLSLALGELSLHHVPCWD
jgi:hypothetical protein